MSLLTTILGVFVRVILAVIITVTHPALRYTVTGVTLEAIGLTCMVANWRQTERNARLGESGKTERCFTEDNNKSHDFYWNTHFVRVPLL